MKDKKQKTIEVKSGNVLLANAFMDDGPFERSVVLIAEHNKNGTLGFILNKSIKATMNMLLEDFPEYSETVFYGGPVENDTIHYLHKIPLLLPDSIHIKDDLYLGGDFGKVREAASSGFLNADNIKFFVGHSGWSKGQLESEFVTGSWVVSDIATKTIFDSNYKKLWADTLNNMGDKYTVISQISNKNKWN